jgi:hypothetical protein
MCNYFYAYDLVEEDDEVFLVFPAFGNIITSINKERIDEMAAGEIESFAHDAVITALQAAISFREDIPGSDSPRRGKVDGFVVLNVIEAMKLQLYNVFRVNCATVGELAKLLGKPATAASRMLNLRHKSNAAEIEAAIGAFGKRLVHDWKLEAA